MDNNTRPEHFVLKEDKIYWIPEMPVKPETSVPCEPGSTKEAWKPYFEALQSAIDSAVEVSNQEEVEKRICEGVRAIPENFPILLQCSVEKKEYCPDFDKIGKPFGCYANGSPKHKQVARVTFPSSKPVSREDGKFCTCSTEEKHGSTTAWHCNRCGKLEQSETWLESPAKESEPDAVEMRDTLQQQQAEIERLRGLTISVGAHDAALFATLREIRRIIFVEMPGMNLDGMGEKYHTKIRLLIDKALQPSKEKER